VTGAHVTDSMGGDRLAERPDVRSFRESNDLENGAAASGGPSRPLAIQPAFDGLRGIAVLLVLSAHFGAFLAPGFDAWPLRGGFLGVDLFFVLSGFLITTILLAELERSGRIRLKRFYLRRVTRLVPALLGLLAVHWVYTAIEGYSLRPERIGTAYALSFTANWAPTWGSNIGDIPLDLTHLWSLGIEGQFYLVWPFVLWALYRWATPRRMVAAMGALIAVVAVVRPLELNAFNQAEFVYSRFDARADALLAGALIAVLYARGRLPALTARRWLAAAGAAGFAVALVFARPDSPALYWGGFTAIAIAGAAILSVTLERRSSLANALSWSPLRSLGLASYSIYLWHLPVYLWAVRVVHSPGVPRVALALSVTALMSTLSYWLLERPYMARRGRLTPSHPPLVTVGANSETAIAPASGIVQAR
jgi:peptidoglycan/LPS O-acetylase OafA/YrhL